MAGGIDVFPAQQSRSSKATTFSTTSTTPVTALSLTGSGILSEILLSQTGGTNITNYCAVIVDGTQLFSAGAVINALTYGVDNFGNYIQGNYNCRICFSKSLIVNVYSNSNTSNFTTKLSYEQ